MGIALAGSIGFTQGACWCDGAGVEHDIWLSDDTACGHSLN